MRPLPLLCLWLATARAGWLDRVVQYRKENFIKDVQDTLPAIEIHARIESAPPGFEDSKEWDFDSVMRLLKLLRESQTGRRVHRALRRMMMSRPNRRIYLSFLDTYKYFPSIHKDNYYEDSDMESVELLFETTPHAKILNDNDVIIVSNPVEARLPSTKISVKMLRAILEERAFAARIMPPTTKRSIEWKPMNSTTPPAGNTSTTEAGGANATEAGGNSTSAGDDKKNVTNGENAKDDDKNEDKKEENNGGADTKPDNKDGDKVTTPGDNAGDETTTPSDKPGEVTTPGAETTGADTPGATTPGANTPGPETNQDKRRRIKKTRRHVKKGQQVIRKGEIRKKYNKDIPHRYKPVMRKHNPKLRTVKKHYEPQPRPKVLPWG